MTEKPNQFFERDGSHARRGSKTPLGKWDDMENEMKENILKRWQMLREGDGLQHAKRLTLILRVASLLALVAILTAITMDAHPAMVALLATVMGWLIAETNALRLRLAQWPIMEVYIDWERVRADLTTQSDGNDNSRPQQGS